MWADRPGAWAADAGIDLAAEDQTVVCGRSGAKRGGTATGPHGPADWTRLDRLSTTAPYGGDFAPGYRRYGTQCAGPGSLHRHRSGRWRRCSREADITQPANLSLSQWEPTSPRCFWSHEHAELSGTPNRPQQTFALGRLDRAVRPLLPLRGEHLRPTEARPRFGADSSRLRRGLVGTL